MRRGLHPFVAAALLALAAAAHAELSDAQAGALMQQSGLWAQMDAAAPQFRMTVESTLQDRRLGVSAALRGPLMDKLARQVTPATLRPRVQALLAKDLLAADLPAYDAWFTSATGQRVVALQQKAEAEAMQPGIDPELPGRRWAAASTARQALLEQVVERSRAAALQNALFEQITPALRGLAATLDPAAERVSEADLRTEMARHTGGMAEAMHRMLRAQYALGFESLGDDELQRWATFLATPAGQRLVEAQFRASVAVPLGLLADLAKPDS